MTHHITYTPPDDDHRWTIQDTDGRTLLGSDTPPSPEILTLIDSALALTHPTKQPATTQAGPTPADLAGHRPEPQPAAPRYRPIRPSAEWMHRNNVSLDRVLEIIANPTMTRPSDNGGTIYTGPGYDIVLGDDDQSILAVRPLVPIGQHTPDQRRAPKTGARRPLPDNIPDFLDLLRAQGYEVHLTGSGHWKATDPNQPGPFVMLPATPSDYRWAENTARDLRHAFGRDPRE